MIAENPGTVFLFEDECSVSSIPTVRWVWAPKGRQPKILTYSSERRRQTIFSSVETSGRLCTLIADKGDSEAFIVYLKEVRKQYPEKKIVMVLDNVSFHKSGKVKDYLESEDPVIDLLHLPPYAPDLNPQEWVFKDFRRCVTHNHRFKTFEALSKAVDRFFRQAATPNLLNYALVNGAM